MAVDRQALADQISDLAKSCGGYSARICCGHGDYREGVEFDDQSWVKFVSELSKIIGNLTDG